MRPGRAPFALVLAVRRSAGRFMEYFEANLVRAMGLDTARDHSVFALDSPDRLVVDIG